ncbi:amino acid permease-domain-containing protein [Aspergillus novoparasiticus]|uniref:Amino acid permease-domain-containing protein n=1 Tax=Aspergillus novoparasiticus TaxID=986946 RepID=A0A5N6F6Z0_9EURO|nr:amino acid permease-domain-containing protein [Aspergillus novoparasiticus]
MSSLVADNPCISAFTEGKYESKIPNRTGTITPKRTSTRVPSHSPPNSGGPGSLLLAFFIESLMVGMLNNCLAEMTTYMPVSGGFIRLAGCWVDEAWGFMAGWNFFIYMALTVPFEISAVNMLLEFRRHDIPVVAAEFWLSSGKVILIFILFLFTFITMLGGNPKGDAHGFRHWQHPGTFAEYASGGDLGRLEGFLGALWTAVFTVVWPEYISTVAAEAKHPRIYIRNAFKTVYWRFGVFFVGGALCVGILVGGESSAAAIPYIIAMKNLRVDVLPHIVSALMVTAVFSAGNTYTYAVTRELHGMATDRRGVPIYSFIIVMEFAFLSLLQLSGSAMQLPYTGLFQPYCGFTPWSTANIFLSYTMLLLAPATFVEWKVYKGARWPRPHEVDLKWKADLIAAYEAVKTEQPIGFWREMIRILDVRRLCNRKRTSVPV